MELLNFSMPPYMQMAWVSKKVKEEWEPKLKKATKAYYYMELLTVARGLRKCTTMHLDPFYGLENQLEEFAKLGLVCIPFRKVGRYSGFSHYHPPVRDGESYTWYGVVAKNYEDANRFREASVGNKVDHGTIGELLGYPTCCTDFFLNVWSKGYYDPVWQQAENSSSEAIKRKEDHFIRFGANMNVVTNVLLRYVNLRLVPHIPCSHDCKHTEVIAKEWLDLAKEEQVDGFDELIQFLSLPVEWDCFKGIAYVSTPLFKIETNSMTSKEKYIVQREGTFYPSGLPKGNKFPWTEVWKFGHGI